MCTADIEQIRSILNGDMAAADRFVTAWYPHIRNWISQRAPSQDVDDLVDDVWHHLIDNNWYRLSQWRPLHEDRLPVNPFALRAYLKTISLNRVRDKLRSYGYRTDFFEDDINELPAQHGASPEDYLDKVRRRELLRNIVIREFNERDRILLRLWLDDQPYAYIAEQLGMTTNNVGVRLNFVKSRLIHLAKQAAPRDFPDV